MSLTTFREAFNSSSFGGQMPESGKLLVFPARKPIPSAEAIREEAKAYLSARTFGAFEGSGRELSDADVLMEICRLLRDSMNADPTLVSSEASKLYSHLSANPGDVGLFDERDFLLGESALLAGSAYRLLGQRIETELWLDRAESCFRHTINSEPQLARVAYVRLALRYDTARYAEVLEFLPSVALTFRKSNLRSELARCVFLKAVCLKDLGRIDEAESNFEALITESDVEPGLKATALLNVGNLKSLRGKFAEALRAYSDAKPLLEASKRFTILADLRAMVGETLKSLGRIPDALIAYREATQSYSDLGMRSKVAYMRVVTADFLLEVGRAREAEWEILAALPIIEEENMAAEGAAAALVLRESVRRRATDASALRTLRNHLQSRA